MSSRVTSFLELLKRMPTRRSSNHSIIYTPLPQTWRIGRKARYLKFLLQLFGLETAPYFVRLVLATCNQSLEYSVHVLPNFSKSDARPSSPQALESFTAGLPSPPPLQHQDSSIPRPARPLRP